MSTSKDEKVFDLWSQVLENAGLGDIAIRQAGKLLRSIRAICPGSFDDAMLAKEHEIQQDKL